MSEALDLGQRRAPRAFDLARFLESALTRPARDGALRAFVMPLPSPVSVPALLRSLRGVDAWHFRGEGRSLLGLGSARRHLWPGRVTSADVPGEGDRFAAIRQVTAQWFATLAVTSHPDAPKVPLRAFVGFSFAPGSARREPWEPFGDALAVLPRWTILDGPERALVLTVDDDVRQNVPLVLAELNELLAPTPPVAPAAAVPLVIEHEPRSSYDARVSAVLTEIAAGRLEKVVVSRRSVLTAEVDLDPTRVLEHLEDGAPDPSSRDQHDATTYFVRRAGSVLCGVTPERLLSVRGRALQTMALAGTAREAKALLSSEKDRAEHQFVVDSISETLAPLSVDVHVAAHPEITPAGSMHHLRTPIEATLRPKIHPLEVAAALHPTSAVAGTPSRAATEWIAQNEPDRGWYASPIGWVDQHGDADLFIALRGGVIRGGRAYVYAGGGVVAGSTPASEHDESMLKMTGFLRALGAT